MDDKRADQLTDDFIASQTQRHINAALNVDISEIKSHIGVPVPPVSKPLGVCYLGDLIEWAMPTADDTYATEEHDG